jgi:hypothetical protein
MRPVPHAAASRINIPKYVWMHAAASCIEMGKIVRIKYL